MKNGPKTLKDTSTKKIHTWQVSIGKDATYHHMTTGKHKAKQQGGYHYVPMTKAKIQNTNNKMLTSRWSNRHSLIYCCWECKMVQSLGKTV